MTRYCHIVVTVKNIVARTGNHETLYRANWCPEKSTTIEVSTVGDRRKSELQVKRVGYYT